MRGFVEDTSLQDIADAIREKTGKETEYKPSEMGGAIRGIDSSGEISKFGIQNEVTGTNIVTCDYVNENEHNVEVKLSSDTVTDFSGCEVKLISGNLFDKVSIPIFVELLGNNGNAVQNPNYIHTDFIEVISNKAYTVKCFNSTYIVTGIWCYDENKMFVSKFETSINCVMPKNARYIMIGFRKSVYAVFTDAEIQEVSDTTMLVCDSVAPYTYEPYTEKTYTTNADGTVEGVMSIFPTMNLVCDTEGVDITAKYYKYPSAEYDRFWDNMQSNGKRINYIQAFNGEGWNDKTFKPKYPIIPDQASYMFWGSKITNNPHVREIDFSQSQNVNYCFQNSTIEHVGVIDTRKCGGVTGVFHSATKLHTIDKMIFSETSSLNTNIFQSAPSLVNIIVEGTIGQSINLQWCNSLSVESAKSIIQHLANYKNTDKAYLYSINFHNDVLILLNAEGNASPNGNSWEEYVSDMGWTKG